MSTGTLLTYDEIRRGLVDQGVPESAAERAAADEIAHRQVFDALFPLAPGRIERIPGLQNGAHAAAGNGKSESRTLVHVGSDRFAICKASIERDRDTLRATFEMPPRTKKNHGRFFGVRQSAAYVRYRNAIVEAVKECCKELALPLVDQPYNLAAVFFVDKPGERADLTGLLQGLCDALQDAGVVSDDWHFRTTDGTRIVFGDERPRVEVTITPTEA